jgi:hypothetical protein
MKYCESEIPVIKQHAENKHGKRRRLFLFNWSSRKMQKIRRSYLKERCEQHQKLNEESSRLDMLLKEESIDESTYERLKKLLKMGYEHKRQMTRRKYGFS